MKDTCEEQMKRLRRELSLPAQSRLRVAAGVALEPNIGQIGRLKRYAGALLGSL